MKSRTKSTREQQTSILDPKSKRINEEEYKQPKKHKKEEGDTRKYLLKTLTLLQQQLKC